MGIFTGKDKNGNLIIQMESIQGLPHTNAIYYLRVITYNGSGLRRIVLKTRGDMREFKFFNELQDILSQNN
ncbi:MAG: hypothetical protein ACI4IE_05530 [Eubacterium sp.]